MNISTNLLQRSATAHAASALVVAPAQLQPPQSRVEARGKFLFDGDTKYWVKGVTYGTFKPDSDGDQFPAATAVKLDFERMAAAGINTVRVYTPPPRWLLDLAHAARLRVMIGLPWEQHVAFLDDAARANAIVQRLRAFARTCVGHPAIFCYAVGNEIPAPIVRWYGKRRIERFIRRLYDAVKTEDPSALVTYVNYPTTEFLDLPFLDLACFNVYLETGERLSAYLARLQNLAGERPLILAELGLDSRRNGEHAQAKSLSWQIETTFAAGCAGTFVFGWTDEWHRGGHDIDDWDFGLVTRERAPKPALAAVRDAFLHVPFRSDLRWPRVSVVVCSYNGARTIRDTLDGLKRLDYPDYEVIVVNDGSRDATPEIAAQYDVKLITTENRGLSNARNTGMRAASGEIVAYIDDDAYPDPHWLRYLAYGFMTTDHVAIGGPNIAPSGDGAIAECVANAPGGPVQVLISDTLAEHIPGCNMAFRRSALQAIGGFDPRYRAAGDDVDVCWRLMDCGWTIGFHAGAMDWHHRRNSLKMYWRQQKGYGKAEALLEEKWPERYNALGHLAWAGRPYGRGLAEHLRLSRARIYQGTWGTAAYQSMYERSPGTLLSLSLMPEWYGVIALLACVSVLGVFWTPLAALAWPLLAFATAMPLGQAVIAAKRARFPAHTGSAARLFGKRLLTAAMHLMQPAARLWGRLRHGLSPWRHRGEAKAAMPWPREHTLWSETWTAPERWVERVETVLRAEGAISRRGGDYDAWDLQIRGGALGSVRAVFAVEEHGGGKQLVRMRTRLGIPVSAGVACGLTLLLAVVGFLDGAWIAGAGLTLLGSALSGVILRDCAFAAGLWTRAVACVGEELSVAIEPGEALPSCLEEQTA
jgi:GT2 family glycosyltransferase